MAGLFPRAGCPHRLAAQASTAPPAKRETLNRGARIRTGDLGHPKAARYQAAPRPDRSSLRARWRADAGGATTARFRPDGRRPPDLRHPLRPRRRRLAGKGRGAALRRDRHSDARRAARALALQRGRDRPAETVRRDGTDETGDDPYRRAAETMDAWREAGALVTDDEPAIWAITQDYTGPDGTARTRHGILARVRVEDFDAGQVLPHERTLPGPKKDRLDLTRATRHNLSPIFSLATKDPWPLVEVAIDPESPWGDRHRRRRNGDQGLARRRSGDPRRRWASCSGAPSC